MPSLAEQQAIQFERNLRSVINRFQAGIIASAKTGELFSMNATDRVRFAPDLYTGIVNALNDSGYYQVVNDLIDRDKELIAEIKELRGASGLPTQFTKQSAEAISAFQNLEFTQFQNIGTGFANSLHQELMNYALSGISERDFIANITAKLDSGFKRYAVTYANTSRAQLTQQVSDEAAKNYDGELYWEYVGAEDDRNRDACIYGLDKQYFTDEERQQFESDYAEERAWNCRHTFIQITKEDYLDNTGGA